MSDAQKFSLVRREAIYTGLALVGLIIFWLCAGFGTASLDVKIFPLPLWAVLGSVGVWLSRTLTWEATTMINAGLSASLPLIFLLLPLIIFMTVMVAISVYVRNRQAGKNFVSSYFVGNRELGGFVLAMTTVATYSSVSSFVGGPGMAFQVGFGWIYMAVVQVTAIFLVLGIFGKRVALLARKLNAVTVVDIIRARFQSDFLAAVAAFVIVLFFCGTMTAQFVGGAKLFAAVTGFTYEAGLILFGLTVVIYTSIGGFRAVALTDTLCALMMMVGIVLLLHYVLEAGGGYENIMTRLEVDNPELFEPFSFGNMPWTIYFTQWLLVGICTIALPQSVVRGISYKNTAGLHQAMLIGTVVVGFMNGHGG